jgi:polyferredoxin
MIKLPRKLYKYIRILLAIYLIALLVILLSPSSFDVLTLKQSNTISNLSMIFIIIFFYIFKEKEN